MFVASISIEFEENARSCENKNLRNSFGQVNSYVQESSRVTRLTLSDFMAIFEKFFCNLSGFSKILEFATSMDKSEPKYDLGAAYA